jgi:RNA polymerase sigma-70 factor (ECF subfamily)
MGTPPPAANAEESVRHVVATLFREEWGRIVATLIHRTGDWDLAEECAQDAFTQALARWPNDGLPPLPGAWLMIVASNRAIDRLRRGSVHAAKLRQIAALAPADANGPDEEGDVTDQLSATEDSGAPDERLRLIFTCCHPAVAMEARVALTLRTLAGLTTAEIARAFLVPEATMAKRLVRAKQKIAHAGIPYRVPAAGDLPQRTAGVLAVLYLLFNEGYSASAGAELVRKTLCDEAVMLARLLAELMPEEPEAKGLLALMMFHRSRHMARVDSQGDLVTLDAQDRTLWDQSAIEQAKQVLDGALAKNKPGPYQLQAAIAGCHALAPQAEMTDWPRIAKLYDQLLEMTGSPVVELNRAVAVAMADGPAVGLALVNELEASGSLQQYYLLAATRADLLRRLGQRAEAAAAYREALALVATGPEQRFLAARLAEVTD